jgi:hypothetical protein
VNRFNVEWKDPEPSRRAAWQSRNEEYRELAETLQANPNRWALVATEAGPMLAQVIKLAKNQHFRPAGSFEATVRGTKKVDGRLIASEIYARYVGDK